MRKHRSLVLSSDDENDTDISSGRANFPLSQQRSNFLINAKTSSALPECGSGNSKIALPQHQKGFCSSTPKMTPQPQKFLPRSVLPQKIVTTPSEKPVARNEFKADSADQKTLQRENTSLKASSCSLMSRQAAGSVVPQSSGPVGTMFHQSQALSPSPPDITKLPCSRFVQRSESSRVDVTKHPLLTKDVFQVNLKTLFYALHNVSVNNRPHACTLSYFAQQRIHLMTNFSKLIFIIKQNMPVFLLSCSNLPLGISFFSND